MSGALTILEGSKANPSAEIKPLGRFNKQWLKQKCAMYFRLSKEINGNWIRSILLISPGITASSYTYQKRTSFDISSPHGSVSSCSLPRLLCCFMTFLWDHRTWTAYSQFLLYNSQANAMTVKRMSAEHDQQILKMEIAKIENIYKLKTHLQTFILIQKTHLFLLKILYSQCTIHTSFVNVRNILKLFKIVSYRLEQLSKSLIFKSSRFLH